MADDSTPTQPPTQPSGASKKKTSARSRLSGRKKTSTRTSSRAATTSRGTVSAVVLLDTYSWHDDPRDPTSPRNDAAKGDTITVSAEEFERAQDMSPQGLAKPSSDEAKVATGDQPADEEPPLTKPDGDPVEESSAQ